jgi:hypothetical protein
MSFKYKGWYCQWIPSEQVFYLFTPDELKQPKGFLYPEMEVSNKEQAKQFINNYNK